MDRPAGRPGDLNRLDRKIFIESLRQAGQLQKRLQQTYGMKSQGM